MTKNTRTKGSAAPLCECGCSTPTKGGKYAPGHDAKHKQILLAAALGGSKRAEDTLQAKGWAKFLDAKRETLGVGKRPTSPKPARTPRTAPDKTRRQTKQGKGAATVAEAGQSGSETTSVGPTAANSRRGRPRKVRLEAAASPTGTAANAPTA